MLISPVQKSGPVFIGAGFASSRTATLSFGSNTTSGSLLVAVVTSAGDSGPHVQTSPITPSIDTPITAGMSWVLGASAGCISGSGYANPTQSTGGQRVSVFYCENAPSISISSSTSVTAHWAGVGSPSPTCSITLELFEFGGIATSGSLETVQLNDMMAGVDQFTPTAVGTPNLMTANKDLIIAANSFFGFLQQVPVVTPGAGYTLGLDYGLGYGDMQYILNQPSGSISTKWTGTKTGFNTISSRWADVALAFKPLAAVSSGQLLAFYRLDGFPGHDAEIPSGALNGANVTFSLAFAPNPAASLFLYKNGNFMVQGTDYTLGMSPGSSIGVITMTKAPASGDHLIAWYRSDGGTLGIADNEIPLGVIDGVNPDFTLAHSALAGTLVLFQRKGDGSGCISLAPTGIDYTNAGTLIIMATPPAAGDTLRAFYRYTPPAGS